MNTRHLTIVHHSFDPNVIAASIVDEIFDLDIEVRDAKDIDVRFEDGTIVRQCQYLRKGVEVCSKAVVDYLSGKKSGE